MNDQFISQLNPLLEVYLKSRDEGASADALAELVTQRVEPLVKAIIRGKLHVSLRVDDERQVNQDACDLVSDVKTLLIGRLTKLRSGDAKGKIDNLDAYVKTVTTNACHAHLRTKYPNRLRLKNQLRYLLTHNERLSLWDTKNDGWFCGSREFEQDHSGEKTEQESTDELRRILETDGILGERIELTDLVSRIFKILQKPLRFGDLVTFVYDLQRLTEPVEVLEDEANGRSSSASEHELQDRIEQAAFLKQLWDEIVLLPLRHRAALLLNLKNTQGEGLITLLPLTRVATISQIAEVLEIPAVEFAKIWNELPWDDLAIADHLKLTRQQVINLRQSARATLRRRLNYF